MDSSAILRVDMGFYTGTMLRALLESFLSSMSCFTKAVAI